MSKKPSLAIVIGGMGKPHGEPDEDDGDSDEGVAADELADAIGVEEGKRGDFKAALNAYVRTCFSKAMADKGDDDENGDKGEGY